MLFLKENWYWLRFVCSPNLFISFCESEFETATSTMSSAESRAFRSHRSASSRSRTFPTSAAVSKTTYFGPGGSGIK